MASSVKLEDQQGQTTSLWMTTTTRPVLPPLERDLTVDVGIVGAGIAGLSTAFALVRQGLSVAVVDDGPIGSGQTQRTTAHLSNAIDDRYTEIERIHGEKGARLAAESHTAAIDFIEQACREEVMDADFLRVDAYLVLGAGQSPDLLDRELAAARRAGVPGVELLAQPPLDMHNFGPCLKFPRQGQFDPMKYLVGLTQAILRRGCQVFGGTHVSGVEGGSTARISTKNGPTVHCTKGIVVATNSPINDWVATHTKQAPYTTYVIGAQVPSDSIPRMLLWDTLDPYHYVRLQKVAGVRDILIVGGEDHKSGQAEDQRERFSRLGEWARERFPLMSAVEYRWSGQVMETIDGLAFIGKNPMDKDNVYIATGDSGMGMTHGTIAGILLSDLLLGKTNPWTELYDPARKSIKAAGEFLKENINVVARYAEWLTSGDVSSADEIPPGGGAVLRRGVTKVALYRDDAGVLHEMSAMCTHLGCVVHWNDNEKTWDCPCHGSRFACEGGVMNGPANRGLIALGKQESR